MEAPNTNNSEKRRIVFTNQMLKALIIPLIFEQLLTITVGLADSLMVSRVGQASISAVNLVDQLSNLMIQIFAGMAAGGAAVAGQYLGKKLQEDARRSTHHMFLLLLAVSLTITAVLYLFRDGVLGLINRNPDPEVIRATRTYYSIVMASIPAIALYNGGTAVFRAMSKSRITLRVSVLMNVINVVGNAVLIFGFGMDVAGVAIPTLVSRTVAAAVILLLLSNPSLTLSLKQVFRFRYQHRMMRNILYIGVPASAENGMFHLGRLVLASLVSSLGTVSQAANGIANTLGGFHHFTGTAISLALVTVISQCIGAGAFDDARYYMKKFAKLTYLAMNAANALGLLLLPLVMKIYGSSPNVSPETIRLATILTVIHGVASMVIWMPAFALPAFLRACGDARFTMWVSMISMWTVRVLFAYIFAILLGWGVIGVWLAHSVLDWIVRSSIFYLRYRSGRWETKAIKS
ncbi:MAG: MATE family efflux transporter [Lachnospiraceae bacterium]|nr:MATE family efflux transporter [Lachnospiraceae bacterium]